MCKMRLFPERCLPQRRIILAGAMGYLPTAGTEMLGSRDLAGSRPAHTCALQDQPVLHPLEIPAPSYQAALSTAREKLGHRGVT